MSIYSRRLGSATGVTSASAASIYTVPAGDVAVVRSVTAYCTTGAGQGFWVISGVVTLQRIDVASASSVLGNELRWVLNAAEVLQFSVGSGTWSVSAHGYLLTA
jgi:hypothetical protein